MKRHCHVRLHTDSKYVQQGISEWMHNWKKRGWKTADKKPVKNDDLWRRLDALVERHQVDWVWVRGMPGMTATSAPTSWPTAAWRGHDTEP